MSTTPWGALLLAAALASPAGAEEAALALPYPEPPATTALAASDGACPAPPPPMRDIGVAGFYADRGGGGASSIVDAEAKKAYETARKPVADFERGVVALAGRHRLSAGRDGAAARCALSWLETWAKAEGFMGRVSHQGGFLRKWALAPASITYATIRDEPSLNTEAKAMVAQWLARWSRRVRDDYSMDTEKSSRRNNHLYWAAWAVMSAGVALDDRAHFDWALARYRFALGQIEDDGTLPLEMARQSKALHYHVYAAAPLVMLAETLECNGVPAYAMEDGALHRLIRRTLAGIEDSAYFAEKSGHAQDWVGTLNGGKIAWMAPYYARFPENAPKALMNGHQPLHSTRLGGDLGALFGIPPL